MSKVPRSRGSPVLVGLSLKAFSKVEGKFDEKMSIQLGGREMGTGVVRKEKGGVTCVRH